MEEINRVKLVLVEKNALVNGCRNNWELPLPLRPNGVQTSPSLISEICKDC